MSEDSLTRLLNRTVDKIPTAVTAGTSEELLLTYFREVSFDAAEWVFITSVGLRDTGTDDLIESFAFGLVKSIYDTLEHYGVHQSRFALEAQAAATRAYYARLSELAAHSATGGAA